MPYWKNTHWCNDRSFSSKKTVTLFSLKSYEDHKETYMNVHVDVLTELICENGKVAILLLEHMLGGHCPTMPNPRLPSHPLPSTKVYCLVTTTRPESSDKRGMAGSHDMPCCDHYSRNVPLSDNSFCILRITFISGTTDMYVHLWAEHSGHRAGRDGDEQRGRFREAETGRRITEYGGRRREMEKVNCVNCNWKRVIPAHVKSCLTVKMTKSLWNHCGMTSVDLHSHIHTSRILLLVLSPEPQNLVTSLLFLYLFTGSE